ncbi:helix-turn-helix domain-containing protein [Streptomyces katsurahamanus]|uniref:helix-turn-helix domain-containing protein n=1 Tax=Streptomyces katsurahamanus TaxID=2577098 RepID=UPI002B20DB1C|nr:helix-turn-helix transcriptional regulator [Streptomyces katsurahamanus]
MGTIIDVPGPGANVSRLRKERGWGQDRLAAASGVSKSQLGKVERGQRTLTQGVAASIARAFGLPLEEVLGTAPVPQNAEESLKALRAAVRRFDLPGTQEASESELRSSLREMMALRGDADLAAVLAKLPDLVSKAQTHAHSSGRPESWSMVSEAYSTVYWLAARHRWMTLADLAVTKQKIAAQQADSMSRAIAARDEAGVHLNHGDFLDGLAVVDRAIVQVEGATRGHERAYALGILHLRGLTLAGRAKERRTADQHIERAWALAEDFDLELNHQGIHFGPENTATHVIATSGDLNRHEDAISIMADLTGRKGGITLPATRVGPLHMNIARSELALGNRDRALEHLESAWAVGPQLAKVHPTSQELLRVLTSRHKRSNPRLTRLAKMANIQF